MSDTASPLLPKNYPVTELDLDTATRTLFGEGRGEPVEGQIAIVHVILNRTRAPGWWSRHKDDIPDDTIAAVCRDPWQFSCWNPSDPNRAKLLALKPADPAYVKLRHVVEAVIRGEHPDPTGGATHYKRYDIRANWADGRTPTARIGVHQFFDIGLHG